MYWRIKVICVAKQYIYNTRIKTYLFVHHFENNHDRLKTDDLRVDTQRKVPNSEQIFSCYLQQYSKLKILTIIVQLINQTNITITLCKPIRTQNIFLTFPIKCNNMIVVLHSTWVSNYDKWLNHYLVHSDNWLQVHTV